MKKFAANLLVLCAAFAITTRGGVLTVFGGTNEHHVLNVSGSAATRGADSASRIERIENGLLPAATIRGQSVVKMTLAERMKHYNVHGVSVAFFAGGQVTWTRVYGFADVASGRRVTTETLFQSASISKPATALRVLK